MVFGYINKEEVVMITDPEVTFEENEENTIVTATVKIDLKGKFTTKLRSIWHFEKGMNKIEMEKVVKEGLDKEIKKRLEIKL